MTDANTIAEGIVLALAYIVLGAAVLWFLFSIIGSWLSVGPEESDRVRRKNKDAICVPAYKWLEEHPGKDYRDYLKTVMHDERVA